jgi:hypothetical protein
MSDPQIAGNWTEQRIATLQNQVSELRADVAGVKAQMTMLIEQNRLIINQLDAQGHGGASLSSTLLSWIALALIVGVAVIFASVYLGAYR